ncbi:hypothetical protein D3C79_992600 [compost metagenome]
MVPSRRVPAGRPKLSRKSSPLVSAPRMVTLFRFCDWKVSRLLPVGSGMVTCSMKSS